MGLFDIFKDKQGAQSPSFAKHVDKFWSEFALVIDEINSDLNAKNYEAAMSKAEEKLCICLAEPFFLIGQKDDKLDLVLTPEGAKHRLFWLNFIKQRMPETLNSKMITTLGKQRSPNAIGLEMYGIKIDGVSTKVASIYEKDGVKIELYEPNLADLLAQDENKAYNLSYILTDNVIGEVACINLIKGLEILSEPKPDMITLEAFADELYSKFDEKATRDPVQGYSVYKLEPSGVSHRKDVVVGSTCLSDLILQHLDEESEIYDEGAENNIRFCYLALNHGGDMQAGLDLRSKIEDSGILEEFLPYILHIGGASGTHFTYIDLISFEPQKLDELLTQISQKYKISAEILDFKAK